MSEREQLEILKRTEMLIKDPARWVQGPCAVNRKGWPVPVNSDEAVSFCLFGALKRVCSKGDFSWEDFFTVRGMLELKADTRFGMSYVGVNEKLGHPSVMDLLRSTIQELEQSCLVS